MGKFLTVNETAALLRISRPTIQRRLRDGTIKYTKIGRRVLIAADTIYQLTSQASA